MLKIVQFSDLKKIQSYLNQIPYEGSIHNLVNVCQWMGAFPLYQFEDSEHCYLLLFYRRFGQLMAIFPLSQEAYFSEALIQIKRIFKHVKEPFLLKWVPEQYGDLVKSVLGPRYLYDILDEEIDYLYEANKMRTYSGKAMQKKRNFVNGFVQENEGLYEFRELTIADSALCEQLVRQWLKGKQADDALANMESEGIFQILKQWPQLEMKVGGVFIAGELKGFSIVTYNQFQTMQINVEKADPDIRGLYPFLAQQVAVHFYPQAKQINREDNGGKEHLKKAKESYHPDGYLKKYTVKQKPSWIKRLLGFAK